MSATVAPIDWNAWRDNYDSMSFADMQDFYAQVAEAYPEQRHYSPADAHKAFDRIGGNRLHVIEMGGWDGSLARDMMARGDIQAWRNFDVADVPQACRHEGYELVILDEWFWDGPVRVGDVFVATHTIEHLSAEHLARLFDRVAVRFIYLEAPLDMEPRDWTGYSGSHKLEIGWQGVNDMLADRGFLYHNGAGLWQSVVR